MAIPGPCLISNPLQVRPDSIPTGYREALTVGTFRLRAAEISGSGSSGGFIMSAKRVAISQYMSPARQMAARVLWTDCISLSAGATMSDGPRPIATIAPITLTLARRLYHLRCQLTSCAIPQMRCMLGGLA